MYLDLMEACLTGVIYRDVSFNNRTYDNQKRLNGGDWPATAHTMIGVKRLHHLRMCCENVIRRNVPGDFIECGVWRGGACIMMKAVLVQLGSNRTVFVADSFEGLPAFAHKIDADLASSLYPDDLQFLKVSDEQVRDNFDAYGLLDSSVCFVKGWFKETLPKLDAQLAILRCDGDLYESTSDILENLYYRLSPGGYCIIDDYGAMHQCRRAVHDFRHKYSITEEIKEIDQFGVYWIKQ